MTTINLTKEEFLNKVMDYESNPTEWKYKGDKPAIVDFYASWCTPCKMLSPVVDKIADEHPEFIIGKINVEEEQELAKQFRVRSVPSLFIMKNGEIINRSHGMISEKKILNLLQS